MKQFIFQRSKTFIMDSSNILQADILDILFDGKNKEYGAYDLRKTYNRRIMKALMTTGAVIILVCTGYIVSSQNNHNTKTAMMLADSVTLVEAPKEDPIPPTPPVIPPAQAVETTKSTPPLIVPDKQVQPEDTPPENDKLDDTRIGAANIQGAKDDGIVAPPSTEATGQGIVEAPKPTEDDIDKVFIKVEQESTYPGGLEAWKRYLNKNFRYPDEAQNTEIQGVVVVKFIVDKEGKVSDVEAVSGPEQGGLREEAMRVIRKSGKWTPAVQNGRQVKSYKSQPITFRLDQQ